MTRGIFYIIRVFLHLSSPSSPSRPTSKSLSSVHTHSRTRMKIHRVSISRTNFSRRLKLEKQSREIRGGVAGCISACALIAKSERAENAENTRITGWFISNSGVANSSLFLLSFFFSPFPLLFLSPFFPFFLFLFPLFSSLLLTVKNTRRQSGS